MELTSVPWPTQWQAVRHGHQGGGTHGATRTRCEGGACAGRGRVSRVVSFTTLGGALVAHVEARRDLVTLKKVTLEVLFVDAWVCMRMLPPSSATFVAGSSLDSKWGRTSSPPAQGCLRKLKTVGLARSGERPLFCTPFPRRRRFRTGAWCRAQAALVNLSHTLVMRRTTFVCSE